jgi:hypothetical protein
MPIPTPEAGLVISYSYLWHFEHQAGKEEGRKTRPAAIVLTTQREDDGVLVVTVLPITHSAPTDPTTAIEIRTPVKRHLGLDEARALKRLCTEVSPWRSRSLSLRSDKRSRASRVNISAAGLIRPSAKKSRICLPPSPRDTIFEYFEYFNLCEFAVRLSH